jgi:hypothetical protein
MEIKNGRKPLAQKAAAKPSRLNLDDIFGNTLGIDPEMAKVIEKQGLAIRFVSASKLEANAGHHNRGWRPLPQAKLKEWGYDTLNTLDSFTFGSDSSGYIRRGDLVLAVRPMELHRKHQAYLAQERQRGKGLAKKHAEEMKSLVKEAGLDMKIHEGFEDEKSSEE